MTSFAYIHCKPDGIPFYVGKGAFRRAMYLGERNAYHKSIVDKYGKENILKGILECSSDKIALNLEVGIIKCFKRMKIKLSNFTDGGDGRNGWIPSQEWKDNIRKMMMGNSYGLGKPVREPIIGINLNDGSTIKFIGKKSIENDGRFVARQVYRCASRDNICEAYSKGIYKGFQFFWESEYLRKVGT